MSGVCADGFVLDVLLFAFNKIPQKLKKMLSVLIPAATTNVSGKLQRVLSHPYMVGYLNVSVDETLTSSAVPQWHIHGDNDVLAALQDVLEDRIHADALMTDPVLLRKECAAGGFRIAYPDIRGGGRVVVMSETLAGLAQVAEELCSKFTPEAVLEDLYTNCVDELGLQTPHFLQDHQTAFVRNGEVPDARAVERALRACFIRERSGNKFLVVPQNLPDIDRYCSRYFYW